MSERTVIIAGFVVLLAAALGALVFARLRRETVASLAETITYVIGIRTVRIVAVLGWAWLGWHFLVR
ncbi:hypothetical protein HLB23_16040 [Nocardia uniformis]|uniref:Uncharacterized protein n=1 Tax=Nocardia uniformis TaxID=53432 RepID=A0A849C4U3_9NOCA|nr:DUF6186 family protein [Nocardia uniformis]NNH71355.1 hypothetical protein [Nocardia uniformis]